MRESIPFRRSFRLVLMALHHHLEKRPVEGCGASVISPNRWKVRDQICREKTHDTRMC
uniref:Uncharacterized protein n=1 Tax=Arundo donax TaxID=35708 RepID=A0A0A9ALL6_ARUDO